MCSFGFIFDFQFVQKRAKYACLAFVGAQSRVELEILRRVVLLSSRNRSPEVILSRCPFHLLYSVFLFLCVGAPAASASLFAFFFLFLFLLSPPGARIDNNNNLPIRA